MSKPRQHLPGETLSVCPEGCCSGPAAVVAHVLVPGSCARPECRNRLGLRATQLERAQFRTVCTELWSEEGIFIVVGTFPSVACPCPSRSLPVRNYLLSSSSTGQDSLSLRKGKKILRQQNHLASCTPDE